MRPTFPNDVSCARPHLHTTTHRAVSSALPPPRRRPDTAKEKPRSLRATAIPTRAIVSAPGSDAPQVYYYRDPVTGVPYASLLPPDHPHSICLQQGRHVEQSRYGIAGIAMAVLLFPVGIFLCIHDKKVRCMRCGEILSQRYD
ncbi:hypothetical protein FA95DRAFT_1494719 [Auriscalpium vulgare]|uniref:Uncharacterized protein n=1 Tax=Auriscalpium vulgare TaxID=40419 RepID=A0ACB8RPD5_9AGAM|nr:hypothetical protein FA95DRAFT_1494719 [Auriscalpium vulgare]